MCTACICVRPWSGTSRWVRLQPPRPHDAVLKVRARARDDRLLSVLVRHCASVMRTQRTRKGESGRSCDVPIVVLGESGR